MAGAGGEGGDVHQVTFFDNTRKRLVTNELSVRRHLANGGANRQRISSGSLSTKSDFLTGQRLKEKIVATNPTYESTGKIADNDATMQSQYSDLQNPFWGPEELTGDFWVSCRRRIFRSIDWRLQVNTRPSLGHPEASLGASWPSDRYAERARGIAGRNVASHGEWTRLRFNERNAWGNRTRQSQFATRPLTAKRPKDYLLHREQNDRSTSAPRRAAGAGRFVEFPPLKPPDSKPLKIQFP